MQPLICDAIANRRLVRFVYEGYERVVEPHLYGVNTAGHEALSGWLVGGWSASSAEPGWRNYLVDRMTDLAVLAVPFDGPRADFNPTDPGMPEVYCRITAPETPPPNADDYYRLGRERLEAGALDEAAVYFERSVALEPHFKTLELLGECRLRLGQTRAAIVPLAASAVLHRGAGAPTLLAEVLLWLDRPEQALELAELALTRDPTEPRALAVQAEARRRFRAPA